MKLIRRKINLFRIVFLLLALGLSSCAKQPGQVENMAIGTDPKTAVTNALLALTSHTYSMDVSTVLTDGGTRRNIMEFIPPDRKRIIDMSSGLEYIVVGQTVYSKVNATAPWQISQLPVSTFMGEGSTTAESIAATLNDLRVVRADMLDGKSVILYGYNSTTSSNGVELHSQTELWVGDADGLPYKMVINGEILGSSTDPTTGETKVSALPATTTTLITFDPPISIEAPIK